MISIDFHLPIIHFITLDMAGLIPAGSILYQWKQE